MNSDNKDIDNRIIAYLDTIPEEFLCKRENCNDKFVFYTAKNITQLVPSTHPVFRIDDMDVIIKVLHSKTLAVNEIKARKILAQSFCVLPARVVRMRNLYLLIMSVLSDSVTLGSLSKTNYCLFENTIESIIVSFVDYLKTNILSSPSCMKKVRYPGRTKHCLINWLYDLKSIIKGMIIVSESTGRIYILDKEFGGMCSRIKKASKSCCLFTGDFNMQNVIFHQNGYYLIDLEYWGYYDTEFLIAKLIGSILFHCDIFKHEQITQEENVYYVNYRLQMMESDSNPLRKLIKTVAKMDVDTQRIKAFIVSRMYYRFKKAPLSEMNKSVIRLACLFDVFAEYNIIKTQTVAK